MLEDSAIGASKSRYPTRSPGTRSNGTDRRMVVDKRSSIDLSGSKPELGREIGVRSGSRRRDVAASVATSDGTLAYDFDPSLDGEGVAVHSPAGTGTNLRMVWTIDEARPSRDHQACDTWGPTDGPITQQGVALRIDATDGEVERAICIMKNIWGGSDWIFNAIGFRSGSFVVLGSVDLSAVFDADGSVPSFPWRMCARVEGRSLEWKVWPMEHPEPDWNDPLFGGRVTLPPDWVYAGQPGFYIGHLGAGSYAQFEDESVLQLP